MIPDHTDNALADEARAIAPPGERKKGPTSVEALDRASEPFDASNRERKRIEAQGLDEALADAERELCWAWATDLNPAAKNAVASSIMAVTRLREVHLPRWHVGGVH